MKSQNHDNTPNGGLTVFARFSASFVDVSISFGSQVFKAHCRTWLVYLIVTTTAFGFGSRLPSAFENVLLHLLQHGARIEDTTQN